MSSELNFFPSLFLKEVLKKITKIILAMNYGHLKNLNNISKFDFKFLPYIVRARFIIN